METLKKNYSVILTIILCISGAVAVAIAFCSDEIASYCLYELSGVTCDTFCESSLSEYRDVINILTGVPVGIFAGLILSLIVNLIISLAISSNEKKGKDAVTQTTFIPRQIQNTEGFENPLAVELSEYKKLLDAGAISQEEFDAKKKQLLSM